MSKTIDGVLLRDFAELLLGRADNVECPDYIADKLEKADDDRIFIYVERPNKDNKLKQLRVWRADAWRTSYTKWLKDKEFSEKESKVSVTAGELRKIAVRRFIRMTGLTEEDALKSVAAIIKSRNEPVCQQLFGIELADLLKADEEFRQYKERIGAK